MYIRSAISLVALWAISQAQSQAFPSEPSAGDAYVGIWIDTSDTAGDTCAAANARMGKNFPIQMLAQSIPLPAYDYVTGAGGEALYSYVAATNTNAAFYLTVYADQPGDLGAIMDSDLVSLGMQLQRYENLGRQVYLRFLPEMGGAWQRYGLQPTLFKSTWLRMHAIIKELAPKTIIVWSPNSSYGYPSGTTLDDVVLFEDRVALDTNHDGQLTAEDDAFEPYYPGDEYIDWAAVSLYYKGPGFVNANVPQPGGYCSQILQGFDPFYYRSYTPFYDTYCGQPNRNCMLSESGAAYHVNITGGSSPLEIQQAWWNDCLFNTTFYELFPQLKTIIMFEHAKYEYDGGIEDYRDYRITNDTTVLTAFQAAAAAFGERVQWANSTITGNEDAYPLVDTAPPISPGATTTEVQTTSITALTNEEVTYTYTAYTAPYYDSTAALSDSSDLPSETALGGLPTMAVVAAVTSGCSMSATPAILAPIFAVLFSIFLAAQ